MIHSDNLWPFEETEFVSNSFFPFLFSKPKFIKSNQIYTYIQIPGYLLCVLCLYKPTSKAVTMRKPNQTKPNQLTSQKKKGET